MALSNVVIVEEDSSLHPFTWHLTPAKCAECCSGCRDEPNQSLPPWDISSNEQGGRHVDVYARRRSGCCQGLRKKPAGEAAQADGQGRGLAPQRPALAERPAHSSPSPHFMGWVIGNKILPVGMTQEGIMRTAGKLKLGQRTQDPPVHCCAC